MSGAAARTGKVNDKDNKKVYKKECMRLIERINKNKNRKI